MARLCLSPEGSQPALGCRRYQEDAVAPTQAMFAQGVFFRSMPERRLRHTSGQSALLEPIIERRTSEAKSPHTPPGKGRP